MIHGVSQSSGAERLVEVSRTEAGVLLVISDRVGNVERDRIVLPLDELVATVMEAKGGRTISGTSPEHGAKWLDIEVRRNEVLLRSRAEEAEGSDAAVGLDDFRDALEGAVG